MKTFKTTENQEIIQSQEFSTDAILKDTIKAKYDGQFGLGLSNRNINHHATALNQAEKGNAEEKQVRNKNNHSKVIKSSIRHRFSTFFASFPPNKEHG